MTNQEAKQVHETIFFALFKTPISNHDRSTYFYDCKKTFRDFILWSEEKRAEIELESGQPVVMHGFDIKYNKIEQDLPPIY